MPQQVLRLGLLFAGGVAALIGARSFLVPETFGQYGHYRAAAVDSVAAHPVKYAGYQVCVACHDDINQKRVVGNHRGVACEVCHGPQSGHAGAPDSITPPVPRDREFCQRCHGYDAARPTGFPQIDPPSHNPGTRCINCHDPHAPVPPRTPEGCGACHAGIARQKIVSRHTDLPCTTCHGVAEQHKTAPHFAARPSKPADRGFCAKCHDPEAVPPRTIPASRDIPRVDFTEHGGRYLCWQCHYPHYPEK